MAYTKDLHREEQLVVFGDRASPLESVEKAALKGCKGLELPRQLVQTLQNRFASVKLFCSETEKKTRSLSERNIPWDDLVSATVDREVKLLAIEQRVKELRELLGSAERIGILLQDDPDPDGLASALALRKLLGRKAQSAPIITMGNISRPENIAMVKLLEIEVLKVPFEELHNFNRIVLVDCQPSFFKNRHIKADVIIDHHPRPEGSNYDCEFLEIREDLGATSTLLTMYLRSANVEFSQRLATALLYGIKADTLMLNRQVSDFDLEAFVQLYPHINNNILRRIERPEVPLSYLESLRAGLKHINSDSHVVVIPLVNCTQDDWIPRAADFALQTEGAHWAAACAVVDDKVIISGRNCGYLQHCGDLFKELFSDLGSAGGHRTMAKAIINKKDWAKRFGGAQSLKAPQLALIINKLISASF